MIIEKIQKFGSAILVVLLTLGFVGCSSVIDTSATAPFLLGVVTDINVLINDSIPLTMEHVQAYDANGDEMSLLVLAGENYTVSGTTVIPTEDFIGDLYVPLQVEDETKLLSEIDTIIVSVTPDILEIQPVFMGARWNYLDTFYNIPSGGDSATITTLSITGTYDTPVAGYSDIYRVAWEGVDSIDHEYLWSNTSTGFWSIGGISSNDTLIFPSKEFTSLADTSKNWKYQPLRYNPTIQKFYRDTTIHEISCTNEGVYVEVPAGIFKCVEYTYTRSYDPENKTTWGITTVASPSRNEVTEVTTKLYYSYGVGYVKGVSLINGVKVTQKVLATYEVEEK